MAEILKGAPVTAALNEKMAAKAAALFRLWPFSVWESGQTISLTREGP